MIIRNDLRPDSTIVPKALQEVIIRVGGRNIYDEPLFRLIRAEDHIVKNAGAWNIFQKGLSIDERGGLGIKQVIEMLTRGCTLQEVAEFMRTWSPANPIRVITGMMERPVYVFNGFIIEKWQPAHTFGSPEDWNALTFMGEPALGPYPHEGAYELMAGPTPYMPSPEEIENAIRHSWRQIEEKPRNPQVRLAQRMKDIQLALDIQERERVNKITSLLKEDTLLYKTISLGAGRVIQERAKKAGLTGHWGN